jgi:hypothetical protein
MGALDDIPCVSVDGVTISLRQVLRQAYIGGHLSFVENAIRGHLIERAVKREGITVSAEEHQRSLALFLEDMHLGSDEDLATWLKVRGMTRAELEAELAQITAFGKLKGHLVEEKVLPYFARHQSDFDAVVLSKITAAERTKLVHAMERYAHGERFRDLAVELSEDHRTQLQGGFVGRMRRRDVDPAHRDALFAAHEGALVGPLPGYVLYHVERVLPAALDSLTRSEIHTTLFAAWLDEEKAKVRIDLHLRDML